MSDLKFTDDIPAVPPPPIPVQTTQAPPPPQSSSRTYRLVAIVAAIAILGVIFWITMDRPSEKGKPASTAESAASSPTESIADVRGSPSVQTGDAGKNDTHFAEVAERPATQQTRKPATCDAEGSEFGSVICGNPRLRRYSMEIDAGLKQAIPDAPSYLGDLMLGHQEWLKQLDLLCDNAASLESCLGALLSLRALAISSLQRPMSGNDGANTQWFWGKWQWDIETAMVSLSESGVLDDIARYHEVPPADIPKIAKKINGFSECRAVGVSVGICLLHGLHMHDAVGISVLGANRTSLDIYQFQVNRWQPITNDEGELNRNLVKKHLLD